MRRHLFWRIYFTLLASLALLAVLGAAVWRLGDDTPPRGTEIAQRVLGALLPPADAPIAEQQSAIGRLARALDAQILLVTRDGQRAEARNAAQMKERHGWQLTLNDGRRVTVQMPGPIWQPVWGAFKFLALVAVAVGLAAHPVVRRLTRRLERLRSGVESWGTGRLSQRVAVEGRDEIAAVAQSFNAAAARVEALVGAHKTLLANASHELRSPLARLRLAIEMRNEAEMERSFGELDMLIEEILLASRLDHAERPTRSESVDLLALAAEEAARGAAILEGKPATLPGDPVLLRRLLRNLLDNAGRHGAPPIELEISTAGDGTIRLAVHDRGGGIATTEHERVFEPFYRPAGTGESAGSWGLGLSLVKQIAERHGGSARCTQRPGGGTSFIVTLRGV